MDIKMEEYKRKAFCINFPEHSAEIQAMLHKIEIHQQVRGLATFEEAFEDLLKIPILDLSPYLTNLRTK
jgi:hypothetical protein